MSELKQFSILVSRDIVERARVTIEAASLEEALEKATTCKVEFDIPDEAWEAGNDSDGTYIEDSDSEEDHFEVDADGDRIESEDEDDA